MEVEGSLWKEAWETAAPMPAAVQRPLFDHTAEAEKVWVWGKGERRGERRVCVCVCVCICLQYASGSHSRSWGVYMTRSLPVVKEG